MKTSDTLLVPLAMLASSKLNPRQHFDSAALAQLKASVEQHGVLENLLVRPAWCSGAATRSALEKARPKPDAFDGRYEIVSGECRWRVSKELKLETLPARVRELTDPELVALNLTEQLARKELTPREEAKSFQRMLSYVGDDGKPQHTKDSLAQSLGVHPTFVYERLRLLDLPDNAADALDEGKIGAKIAVLIARIPDKAARAAAASAILKGMGDGEPMTKRQAAEYVAEHCMKELKGAPFDQEDATLVKHLPEFSPHAPCSSCPFRTGNNKELYGDVKRGDICTRPACYQAKVRATFERMTANATQEGKRVLTSAESLQEFPAYSSAGDLAYNSPYVILDRKPEPYLVKSEVTKTPKWRELVERAEEKGIKVPVVIAQDQTGRVVELALRDAVVAAATKAGEPIFAEKAGRSGATSVRDDEQARRAKEEKDEAARVLAVTLRVLQAFFEALLDSAPPSKLRQAMLVPVLNDLGGEGAWLIGKWQGLKLDGPAGWTQRVASWVKAQPLPFQEAMLPLLVLATGMRFRGVQAAGVAELAAVLKVDVKALEKEVRAELKARSTGSGQAKDAPKKPEKSAVKKEPKKKSATTPAGKPAKKKTGGAAGKAVAAVKSSMKPANAAAAGK